MNLLNRIRNTFSTNTVAVIDQDNNLFDPTGSFVASYSRRRDALRGAKRRGFEVA